MRTPSRDLRVALWGAGFFVAVFVLVLAAARRTSGAG